MKKKKLLGLKQWLTVPDAARHLGILFGEDVSEADVLRLALDGRLTLSVNFVNYTYGRFGFAETKQSIRERWGASASDEVILQYEDVLLGAVDYNGQPKLIRGIWDLTMDGAEVRDVEQRYQELTGGPAVAPLTAEGPELRRDDGTYCQLLEKFSENEEKNPKSPMSNFYPAYGLPADSVLVVRTSSLRAFEARLSEPSEKAGKPIGPRERNTLLVIVAALCKLAKIDVTRASAAATTIDSVTATMGARVAARTIENHLKRIPEALDARNT